MDTKIPIATLMLGALFVVAHCAPPSDSAQTTATARNSAGHGERVWHRSVEIRWATLSRRLRGERIVGLRYDAESGYVVLELEGAELWLSADRDGYHLFVDEGAAQGGISRDAVEDL